MAKSDGQQVDPRKLGEAMKGTSTSGKTPEQWANEVWKNAQKR